MGTLDLNILFTTKTTATPNNNNNINKSVTVAPTTKKFQVSSVSLFLDPYYHVIYIQKSNIFILCDFKHTQLAQKMETKYVQT